MREDENDDDYDDGENGGFYPLNKNDSLCN